MSTKNRYHQKYELDMSCFEMKRGETVFSQKRMLTPNYNQNQKFRVLFIFLKITAIFYIGLSVSK